MINQIESVQKIICVNSVDTVNFVAGQGGILVVPGWLRVIGKAASVTGRVGSFPSQSSFFGLILIPKQLKCPDTVGIGEMSSISRVTICHVQ